MNYIVLAFALLFSFHSTAHADPIPERLAEWAAQSDDLQFPTKVSTFGLFTSPQFALYKPDGPGPFPALVLLHQCGGLQRGKFSNTSMLEWAKKAVARGYVALLIDSLGPRGVDTVCYGFKGGVNWGRGLKDVQQAAQYLRTLEYVDKNRVALAGYSWGAAVGLLASSSKAVETLNVPGRFNAIASFYPPCHLKPKGRNPYELITNGIDRPLLVLLGGQDNETPPQECIDRLEPMKQAGASIELHTYPEASHCWDCKSLDGFSKTDARGNFVVYRYDEALTKDAEERMFAFFEKSFTRGKRQELEGN
ncbi:MAG: dienelactone hydrolase family protein [Rhodoferax sp.]